MLKNHDTKFYRNEEEFQWTQRNFLTCMTEASYGQKIELSCSMLSFLTIIFSIILYIFHMKIIYAALMALDEITHVYRADAAVQP